MDTKEAPETKGIVIKGLGAKFYDVGETAFGLFRKFRQRTVELAGIQPDDRVLDVGCGTGTLAILAALQVGESGRVVGIDASGDMIRLARLKASRRRVEVDFEVALVEDIPFEDNYFDRVTSSLMVHHLPHDVKKEGLAEIRRVLKPGGHLLVVDWGEPVGLAGKALAFPHHAAQALILLHRKVGSARNHEHLEERLPDLVAEAGFDQVKVVEKKFGVIDFISAYKKPEAAAA